MVPTIKLLMGLVSQCFDVISLNIKPLRHLRTQAEAQPLIVAQEKHAKRAVAHPIQPQIADIALLIQQFLSRQFHVIHRNVTTRLLRIATVDRQATAV
ncbi:MAG: hypothetical protein KF726_23520 [Anaerolineae bacterium]|nr:hypothetical protein [Anaerolineae bacterium]